MVEEITSGDWAENARNMKHGIRKRSFFKMTHEPTAMTRVQDPSCRFRQGIRRIDDTRNVVHQDLTIIFPVLNGKSLDVDRARALSTATSVGNLDRIQVLEGQPEGT